VLVVGSGVAGACAAIAAAEAGAEVLIVAGAVGDDATRHAQGGIAAALGDGDSTTAHAVDTLRAAAGLGDARAVDLLVTEGADHVRALITGGLEIDRDPDGRVALGLEAAHGHRRIVHSGGDRSGAALADHLASRMHHMRIERLAPARMVELLVRDGDGAVTGAIVQRSAADGSADGDRASLHAIDADAVVLATGGLGRCYPQSSTPPGARGDGLLAAWDAGAQLADLEFVQFHPTTLPAAGGFLVSEAVRGAGATLVDEHGRRFMLDDDERGELAPRDVVAAGVARAIERQHGRPVFLDATAIVRRDGAEALRRRFPTIDAVLRSAGIDWTHELVPIAPAAHFSMGGIRTDLHGRSSIPGLLAAGECARTGVHGANRLASNSLLEGLVFGTRAGRRAALDDGTPPPRWRAEAIDDAAIPAPTADTTADAAARDAASARSIIGTGMGIERDGTGLQHAVDALDRIVVDPLAGADAVAVARLGRLIGLAGLRREESRGAHRRRDHPEVDPALAHPLTMVRGRTALGSRTATERSEPSCSLTP
jgi:L-aspartate oxidase